LKSNQIYNNSITEKNNLTESLEQNELKNLQTEKTQQYQEIYNKRTETLDRINKSTTENEKDFYRKNIEWRKKM
jgi:hypothetical protein